MNRHEDGNKKATQQEVAAAPPIVAALSVHMLCQPLTLILCALDSSDFGNLIVNTPS